MIIPINKKYRIASDSRQWMLQQFHKASAKKPDRWESVQFYSKLDNLVGNLSERMLRESDAVGIAEAMVEVKRIATTLTNALRPFIIVPDIKPGELI